MAVPTESQITNGRIISAPTYVTIEFTRSISERKQIMLNVQSKALAPTRDRGQAADSLKMDPNSKVGSILKYVRNV